MPLSWIEALVTANENIIACERRLLHQCMLVANLAEQGHVTCRDEMLLASYTTSLTFMRAHRNDLLAEVRADA